MNGGWGDGVSRYSGPLPRYMQRMWRGYMWKHGGKREGRGVDKERRQVLFCNGVVFVVEFAQHVHRLFVLEKATNAICTLIH